MITCKLHGFKELARDLKQLPVKIQKQVLRQSMKKGAEVVAETAKSTNSFTDRTGNLRRSIKAKTARDKPGQIGALVEVGEFYGRFIEKGFLMKRAVGFEARGRNTRGFEKTTSGPATQIRKKLKGLGHFPARPFLVPALAQNREGILQNINEGLKKLLAKKLGARGIR